MTWSDIRCIIVLKERDRTMTNKLKLELSKIKGDFIAALPTILFFLFLFCTFIWLFGISYVILVSVITMLFKINYQKCLTAKQFLLLIVTQFLMMTLGFFATLNLTFCIILNMVVPFVLVLLQSSQFNQMGYFANAMCFTFIQLRSVGVEGFTVQLAAMAYGLGVLALALIICSVKNKKPQDFSQASKGLLLLAEALRKCLDKSDDKPDLGLQDSEWKADIVFEVLQGLYKEAYKSRGLTRVVTIQGRIQYMFALLFQRAVYFITNPNQVRAIVGAPQGSLLSRLADYMELAGGEGFRQSGLADKGKELLDEIEGKEDIPSLFAQNFLRLFLLILENIRQMDEKEAPKGWHKPDYKRPMRHLKTDAFETRFALRLSVVLTLGFACNMISQADHGYWLVLNAFLLLRPMYEDSAYRMRTRFIGTAAGCILMQFLLPLLHGSVTGHLVFAVLMAAGLYMEAAGTWIQALFSTCFGLTLTTLAIPHTLAIELRIFYVALAVCLVLVVNRFFFPTSLKSQFQYNLQQLFHIHHIYLCLLSDSLIKQVDYGSICDVQIKYHLVHDQILQYLNKKENTKTDFVRELLWISWHMVSETEQMLYLINNRRTKSLNTRQMEQYLIFTDDILRDIQKKMNMKTTPEITSALYSSEDGTAFYKRRMEGEPQLSALMEQYSRQVSQMYLCVCRNLF